jgi:rod shape-determining protein MreC
MKLKEISLNKKNATWLKFIIGFFIILIFIATLNFFNSGLKNTFYSFSFPFQKTFWTAGESTAGFFSSFANASSLSKQNENLKSEVQKLQLKVASLQSIVGGNAAQSQVSSVCQDMGFDMKMAGVIGLDGDDIITINKGSSDGIAVDMPVISQQGVVFGKVLEVYKNFAKVMLISNKNSVIAVRVQKPDINIVENIEENENEEEIKEGEANKETEENSEPKEEIKQTDGVLKGQGNLGVYLDLVSVDDMIADGEILVTSSLEKIFPKDLLVGTITKINKNDQATHQSAKVLPFLESSTDNLFVITNYKR